MEWLHSLLHNTYFVWCAMAVFIFLITQILKLFIKYWTNKIKNERKRKIVNSVILLIPFGVGILAEFLYEMFYLHCAFTFASSITGLGYGMASIALYSIVERGFKVKISNPFDSEEGKAVIRLIEGLVQDGKISEEDFVYIQQFIAEIASGGIDKQAQKNAQELINEVTKDGKVDETDMTAVEEFLKSKDNGTKT